METFPIELWVRIFQNLAKTDWLVLSRVCHLSSLLAQAELYKTIHLSQHLLVGCTLADNWEKNLLARSFVNQPGLAKLVRAMEISPTFAWRHRLETFANLPAPYRLMSFSNLQSLQVYNLHIDDDFCAAIQSLSNLRRITLSYCDVDPKLQVVKPARNPTSGTPVDLSIYWPNSTDGWTAIVPGALRSLTIADPSAREAILSNFMLHGQNHSLTKLCFTNELPSNIVSFLQSTSQLRQISLEYIPDPPHPIHSLPSDAIPLLEHFSGPAEHSEIFLKGRPIHTITMCMLYELPVDALLPLKSSFVPVKALALDFGPNNPVMNYLQHAPTTLHYLRCEISTPQHDLALWGPTLSRMINLRNFEVRCLGRLNPSLDKKKAAYAISEDCPSLREILFDTLEHGEERWRKSSRDIWECYHIY